MSFAVAATGYTLISSCDTATAGGTWDSSPIPDSANYKYSAASLSEIQKASGINAQTFTPTAAIDMSSKNHLRFWFICSSLGLLDVKSAGGIQVGISDGTNTAYFYLAGLDTYAGGWINFVVDVATATVDSGTRPTGLNAITSIIFVINQTAGGKNVDNVWIDHICLCDGLEFSGNDAAAYADFDDVFLKDNATTLATGVIRKIGGVYYAVGSLDHIPYTTDTEDSLFQAKGQIVVFEDRPVNITLYGITITDSGGTYQTKFILGDKVGSSGVQGCTIKTEDLTQDAKFSLDAKTDTDVDFFKMYATSFVGAGLISFAKATTTDVEILGCNFEQCDQVDPHSGNSRGLFFINTSNVDAAMLWNESIDIQDSTFIGNTVGAAIEHATSAGTPYGYTDLVFSGNTYDGLNTSGVDITVNNNGTSNAANDEGANTITYVSSVPITITVRDDETKDVIENAQVSMYYQSVVDGEYDTLIMNEDTLASGIATESYTGTTPKGALLKVRKSEDTDDPRFKAFSDIVNIASGTGYTRTVYLKRSTILT